MLNTNDSILMSRARRSHRQRDLDLTGEDLEVDGEGDEVADAINGASKEGKTWATTMARVNALMEVKRGSSSALRMVVRRGGRGLHRNGF
ncbi:hypothetical protein ACLB2K_007257 [Fragaria x ananassa]